MLNRRIVFAAAAQACLLSCAAFGQTTSTPAKTFTRTFTFLPVGLALTETAQIAVVNTATATGSGTAASCTGTIAFLNASGAVIGTATPFTSVASGQISVATLPYGSAGGTGARVQIRAEVQLTGAVPATAPCSLSFSLQTFDTATGVTHVYVGDGGSLAVPLGR